MIRISIILFIFLFLFSDCRKPNRQIVFPSMYSGQIPSKTSRGENISIVFLDKDKGYSTETFLDQKENTDANFMFTFKWKVEDDTLLIIQHDSTSNINYFKIINNNFIIKLDTDKKIIDANENYIITRVK